MKKLAIFASGSGSNAENIATYFEKREIASVDLILCNNPKAGVLERASRLNIPTRIFSKEELHDPEGITKELMDHSIDLVILAGFLLKIPSHLIQSFPMRILNIHPALLPKFGGKGMYGHYVHQAVIDAKEAQSGITIHFVNEKYDEGKILFQASCDVDPNDTPDALATKIHALEHEHFPVVIESVLENA